MAEAVTDLILLLVEVPCLPHGKGVSCLCARQPLNCSGGPVLASIMGTPLPPPRDWQGRLLAGYVLPKLLGSSQGGTGSAAHRKWYISRG